MDKDPDLELIEDERKLKPGDQIAVKCSGPGIVYYHHGTFISHQEGVIDFGASDEENAPIRKVSLFQFMLGPEDKMRHLVRINYLQPTDPPEVVIKRAREIYESQNWDPYHLLTNNCEHFAVYCKIGKKYSSQAVEAMRNKFAVMFAIASSTGISGSLKGLSGSSKGLSGSSKGFSGSSKGFSGSSKGLSGSSKGFSGSSEGFSGSSKGFSGSSTGLSGSSKGLSGSSTCFSGSSKGLSGSSKGLSGSSTGFSGSPEGFSGSPTGFSDSSTGLSGSSKSFSGSSTGFSGSPTGFSGSSTGLSGSSKGFSG